MLIGVIALLLLLPASGMAKKKDYDVTGTYSVRGYNPGVPTSGTPNYTGTLTVEQSKGAYLLTWKINSTGKEKVYKGVGIYSDGIFSTGYEGGKETGGVVSYKVEGNTMKGVWAPITGGQFGFEIAERR